MNRKCSYVLSETTDDRIRVFATKEKATLFEIQRSLIEPSNTLWSA